MSQSTDTQGDAGASRVHEHLIDLIVENWGKPLTPFYNDQRLKEQLKKLDLPADDVRKLEALANPAQQAA